MCASELLTLGLIGLVMLTVYASALTHGWVYEDASWQARMGPTWRPVADLSLWTFNLQTWLGQPVAAFHAVNIALHALNGWLVYRLTKSLAAGSALLAATIFWLHPIQREAVDYISGRPELLATTGLLLMLIAVLAVKPGWALICGVLACLAKLTAGVGFAIVAVLIAIRWQRERELRAVGWLLMGLGTVALTVWSPISLTALLRPSILDLLTYAGHQAVAVWRLLGLVIVPVGFSIDHDYGWVTLGEGLLALGALGMAVRWGWALRHRNPVLAWAGLSCVLAVAPRFVSLGAYAFALPPELNEHQFAMSMIFVSIGLSVLIESSGLSLSRSVAA